MSLLRNLVLPAAASLAIVAAPAFAGSLSASSAAGGSSASSATSASSASLETSSDSSSKSTEVAEGPYRIIEVATVPQRPGVVRMTLRSAGDGAPPREFALVVPQPTFERSGLAAGQIVLALVRPYGLEFADGGTRQPFFLVLDDDWVRELPSRPVTL